MKHLKENNSRVDKYKKFLAKQQGEDLNKSNIVVVNPNESYDPDSVEGVQRLFEVELLAQPFIAEMFDKDHFGNDYVYDIDHEEEDDGRGGEDYRVWIMINNPKEGVVESFENYAEAAKPFEEWCKHHNLMYPSIGTCTDNTCVTFEVMTWND